MANSINMSYLLNYQNASQLLNQKSANQKANAGIANQSALPQLDNYNLSLSVEGLDALQNQNLSDDVDTGIFTSKELSPKAQALLDQLREKYGDYDFIVADNVDDVQSLTSQSDKKYSVVLSSDELEKMAEDEDYANEIMGKVEDAVKTADSVIEKAGLEGVQISQLTISFDDNGNTKMFATLEKLSESQQARLDAAKERAEEEDAEKPLGTVAYDAETGELSWILSAEEIWPIASDPNLTAADRIITRDVAFQDPNSGATVVVTLKADVAEIEPYKIPIERYIPNYWTDNFEFTLYNVATPEVGETDSTLCVFENNINASFYTDATGVINLEGIGPKDVQVTSIEYFFCEDMETYPEFKKVGDIEVQYTVGEAGDSLYATVKVTPDSTVTECIAVIDNASTLKDKTPNVVILDKTSDVAKLLLNTCPGLDELGNPLPGELKILLGAYGNICGDENGEGGFQVNLLWRESEDGTEWFDHFAAKYRQPVLLSDGAADVFIDAVDFGEGGSFITIKDLINPMDWRARFFDPQKDENFVVKPDQVDGIDYFSNYWEYYGEIQITVDTTSIRATLGFNGEEIDLPVTVDVKVVESADDLKGMIKNLENVYRDKDGKARQVDGENMTIEQYIDSLEDGGFGFLTYRNNLTNVTKDFELKVPVQLRYGWGVIEKIITVKVYKTPESFQNK